LVKSPKKQSEGVRFVNPALKRADTDERLTDDLTYLLSYLYNYYDNFNTTALQSNSNILLCI